MIATSNHAWTPGVLHPRGYLVALALLVSPALAASSIAVTSNADPAMSIDAPSVIPTQQAARNWFAPPPAPAPLPTPGALVLSASVPVRLSLPSIGVESDLMELGLTGGGELEVPPTAYPAGWFSGAPTPGEVGPAVIAGHVDWASDVGVFHDLHKLAPGDIIRVLRADGVTAVFVVDTIEQYPKDAFPTATVYGNIDHAGLRLITCGGEFDWDAVSHRDNIVVFATLDRVIYSR